MNMNIMSTNHPAFYEQTKKDAKQLEEKGTSKAQTPEDSLFKTDGPYKKDAAASSANTSGVSAANESKLSAKAQDFLKNLRGKYGDYDFFVGNRTDDLKSLVKSGTKEFSIVFSNAELERMANDEKYAQEKLQSMERAVKMSEEINKQYGFTQAGASDVSLSKIGIVFHEDGTTSFFAELEKTSAKQKERIENGREEKRTQKKEEARKAKKELQNYAKTSTDTKYATVSADSVEELFEKISAVDWTAVKSEKAPESGGKFDFSV